MQNTFVIAILHRFASVCILPAWNLPCHQSAKGCRMVQWT